MALDVGLLSIRLVVGLLLVGHGTQKLFGWFGGGGPEGTGGFFASLGYPAARSMAVLAGATEAGAGALLAIGLATPLAAAGIIGVMLNAIVAAHLKNGLWVTKGGIEYPLVLATVAFGLAWIGPGAYSIDRAIGWYPARPVAGLGALGLGVAGALVILATRRPAAAQPQQQTQETQKRPGRAA